MKGVLWLGGLESRQVDLVEDEINIEYYQISRT